MDKCQNTKIIRKRGKYIMAEIKKDMTIAEIINTDRGVVEILAKSGMHCAGCPSAQAETLEEAGVAHGIELDTLIDQINAYLASK